MKVIVSIAQIDKKFDSSIDKRLEVYTIADIDYSEREYLIIIYSSERSTSWEIYYR